jgi:hypothetical protein
MNGFFGDGTVSLFGMVKLPKAKNKDRYKNCARVVSWRHVKSASQM